MNILILMYARILINYCILLSHCTFITLYYTVFIIVNFFFLFPDNLVIDLRLCYWIFNWFNNIDII